MATHNPKESRNTARPTLEYIYRGEGHEHDVKLIKHLGGNLFSQNPIKIDAAGDVVDIDLDQMTAEFEAQAKLHTGKGDKLFKHYVISLAPGESLTPAQWLEMITEYMSDLGYDNSCKWVAVEHADSACKHAHIFSSLVTGAPGGALVKTGNDYSKGWASMRKYEEKFGLRQLQNPDENFGHNFTKGEMKGYGSREEAVAKDHASIIRARFKSMYEADGKPKTMTDLVVGLAKKGVEVSVSKDSRDEISGISYRADKGPWISGSKVKATRFTWKKLQEKEGISYVPRRDDVALGAKDSAIDINISIELKEEEVNFYMKKLFAHKRFVIEQRDEKYFIDYRGLTKKQREIVQMMMMILAFFDEIFGSKRVVTKITYRNYPPVADEEKEAELKKVEDEVRADMDLISLYAKEEKMEDQLSMTM